METRTLKAPTVNPMAKLGFELLNGVTKVHLNHLKVSGTGSLAAHMAMGDFYDKIGDLADDIIEGYQGATETLLTFPENANLPLMKTAQDCLVYMRELYELVNRVQSTCKYSEINNQLDEVKALINKTKYKLIFLQ